MKSFYVALSLFFFSCSFNKPYEKKRSLCNEIVHSELENIEHNQNSIYFIKSDLPSVLVNDLAKKFTLSDTEKEEMRNKIYNSLPKKTWLSTKEFTKECGRSLTLQFENKQSKQQECFIFMEELDSIEIINPEDLESLFSKELCMEGIVTTLLTKMNGNNLNGLKMKIGIRKFLCTYTLVDENIDEHLIRLNVGYCFHYGPW